MTDSAVSFYQDLRAIGLTPAESSTFFGIRRDYPVAITFRESKPGVDPISHIPLPGSLILLIQVRHSLPPAHHPGQGLLRLSNLTNTLLKKGQAKLTFEGQIVWLIFYEASSILSESRCIDILDELLDALVAAEVPHLPNRCERCRTQSVDLPVFENGRVSLICATCISDQQASIREQMRLSPEALVKLAWRCPIAGCIAAFVWAGAWIALDSLVAWVKSLTGAHLILISTPIELLLALGAAFLVSCPVWYMIRRIPARGDRFAAHLGLICCIVAILFGEWLYWIWAASSELGPIRWTAVLEMLPRLWFGGGPHTVMRAVVAGLAAYLSYHYSRPVVTADEKLRQ